MKKANLKTFVYLLAILTAGLFIYSFTYMPSPQDNDEWVVPAKYKNMKNPTDKNDRENLSIGKSLYMKHCKSCHGKTGLGDGPKSDELDTDPGDFSTDLNKSTDGELFYKIKTGKGDMPSFQKKIRDDEDIWLIVNFIRTFKE